MDRWNTTHRLTKNIDYLTRGLQQHSWNVDSGWFEHVPTDTLEPVLTQEGSSFNATTALRYSTVPHAIPTARGSFLIHAPAWEKGVSSSAASARRLPRSTTRIFAPVASRRASTLWSSLHPAALKDRSTSFRRQPDS